MCNVVHRVHNTGLKPARPCTTAIKRIFYYAVTQCDVGPNLRQSSKMSLASSPSLQQKGGVPNQHVTGQAGVWGHRASSISGR